MVLPLSASLRCFCSRAIFSKNVWDKLPWNFFVSGLHTWLMIISRSSPGLATDSPCDVWGCGWPTWLLHDSPFFRLCFWERICVFKLEERNFLLFSCLYPCFLHYPSFAYYSPLKWFNSEKAFQYSVLCTLLFHRRNLHSFLYDNHIYTYTCKYMHAYVNFTSLQKAMRWLIRD